MDIDVLILDVLIHGDIPLYASDDASGADLRAYIESPITILPLERVLVSTNTYVAIPKGYEGQIRPRSGLSIKYGITLINSPGTIDSDYRGEIKIPMINLSNNSYTISPNDRIAQLVIAPYVRANFIQTSLEDLPSSDRGSGGFGSTGI